jgi:hypothetical protein
MRPAGWSSLHAQGLQRDSTWGRAQAWGILSVMSYLFAPDEALWLEAAERGADWWIAHVPTDHVAFSPPVPVAPSYFLPHQSKMPPMRPPVSNAFFCFASRLS